MTSPEPAMAPERAPMTSRADELVPEFRGDAQAAIVAQLEAREALMLAADRATSRGFLRAVFSEEARAPRDAGEIG